jgi:proline iminopeptidase
MKVSLLLVTIATVLLACAPDTSSQNTDSVDYFDNTGRDDVIGGGIRMIPIETPKGTFNVWTKRTGNNPTMKVLLLHGGPGGTHEFFAAFDSYFPAASIEYYYYDQLGSLFSDQPDDPSLWNIPRFVEEVEQVRLALGLGPDNFYLFGWSWGGILAVEYALKYQQHLKGLIISNMMMSIPAYNEYGSTVLFPQMDQEILAEIRAFEAAEDYANPKYFELLVENYYVDHILRKPFAEWPEPVVRGFEHLNPDIYVLMQGPSELGASGLLAEWDRIADLGKVKTPTLVIGAEHDTMDPKHMEWMAGEFPDGHYLYCPDGTHLAMYDDQERYFEGLIKFIRDVDARDQVPHLP